MKYCTLCLAIAIQGCVQRRIKRRDNNYILNLAWVEIHVRCILCRLLFYNNCPKVIHCCNNQYVGSVCLTWFATQQSRWQIVTNSAPWRLLELMRAWLIIMFWLAKPLWICNSRSHCHVYSRNSESIKTCLIPRFGSYLVPVQDMITEFLTAGVSQHIYRIDVAFCFFTMSQPLYLFLALRP